ncbi:MAG: DegT/DnrJ/EryC1/StrS family aminotransferase [Ktedonobacterales bacterium]
MSTRVSTPSEIPLVDLHAQYEPLKGQILNAIASVLDSMHLMQGPQQHAFEEEFARFCGSREAVGVSNGTDALELALRAAGVQPGDEVISQPNTFIATAEAISAVGARPVFVDVDDCTAGLDPVRLESHITPRTRAIIPVHLYGRPADMDPIVSIAHAHGVAVIEDACQAHGARLGKRRAGSLGDIACFSFYYSKNLGAYGEAGAVTTNDPVLAERVRLYRDHGSAVRYHHEVIGRNARMDEIQASILRIKLRHLEHWNDERRTHATHLSAALGQTSLRLPVLGGDGVYDVFHLYVVRHPERDRLRAFLAERGIATGIHYPVPIHLQPAYAWLGYGPGAFPTAERWASQCLSLPMYAELSSRQIERIAAAVHEFDITYGCGAG